MKLIQVYKCRLCSSIGLEAEEADRSDDYEYHCPFCDDGEDDDIDKAAYTDENAGRYEAALEQVTEILRPFFKKKYSVRGCRQRIENGEAVIDSFTGGGQAQFWGVYEAQYDGTESWIADFIDKGCAETFALEKEKEKRKWGGR